MSTKRSVFEVFDLFYRKPGRQGSVINFFFFSRPNHYGGNLVILFFEVLMATLIRETNLIDLAKTKG